MRIWVYVEGTSDKLGLEALFRNETSDWRKRGTSVQLRPLNGKGNILREVGRHARLALDNGRVDHVFVLVDLYPGHTEAEALRQELRALIAPRLRSRFHAHVAVHDFEAWVLAAPEALCARLGVKHLSGFNSPETVNDQKPPAEHLKGLRQIQPNVQKELGWPGDSAAHDADRDCRQVSQLSAVLSRPVDLCSGTMNRHRRHSRV